MSFQKVMMSTRLGFTYSIPNPRPLQQIWKPRHGVHFGSKSITTSSNDHTWKPTSGISFSSNSHLTMSSSTGRRRYNNAALAHTESYESNLALHSYAEDAYVLSGHFDPPPTDEPSTPTRNTQTTHTSVTDAQVCPNTTAREHPALEFQIPQSVFEAAHAGRQDQYWSYKLYTGKNDRRVKIHYCKSIESTERVLQDYFMDKNVLGFDIEWRPLSTPKSGPKANVSLIQLGCEDRIVLIHVALFQNESIDGLVAPSLRKIMESPEVTKVGVSIKSDCTRIRTYLGIHSQGIFELSHLHKLVKYTLEGQPDLINKKLVSLATQVQEHLGLPLYKGDDVRGSDWSQALDMQQLVYAAGDSYAGFMLYDVLESKRKLLQPPPPRPHHAEKGLPIRTTFTTEVSGINKTPANLDEEDVALQETTLDDLELSMSALSIEKPNTPSRSKTTNVESPLDPGTMSLLQAGSSWSAEYQKTQDSRRGRQFVAGHAQLRAYALWQRERMDIQGVASLLKVQKATAAAYVLETVRLEKLPYEKERLKVLMNMIPDSVRSTARGRCYLKLL